MKFYQVKREADNKKLDKNWNIFVGGELFTEKNKTYWLFGARFPFPEYKVEA